MAGETANSPEKPTAGSRSTPVLVPQGDFVGKPDLPLDRPVTTVGSRHSCRLHLLSRSVSKAHALFVNSGSSTYVADLASRNGVQVNGKAVKYGELKTGDRVQIGKFLFRFRALKTATPPEPFGEPPAASIEGTDQHVHNISGRTFLIGRREGSDIRLKKDADVSTSHAVVFAMNGDWYIRDLGSRTGTHVNDQPVHQHQLSFGDRIVIGGSAFLFQSGVSDLSGESPDIAEDAVEIEESPQSSRIPLAVDSIVAEPVADLESVEAAPAGDEVDLDFFADEPVEATTKTLEPEPVELDHHEKGETLIPLETTDAADFDLADKPAALPEQLDVLSHEPEPTTSADTATPGQMLVDADLHQTDRLSGSGTHTDLQHEADEALADAGIAGTRDELPLAAAPADAELVESDAVDAVPLAEEAEPTAEVSPRRGWRSNIPTNATETVEAVDETPSPVVPGESIELPTAELPIPAISGAGIAPLVEAVTKPTAPTEANEPVVESVAEPDAEQAVEPVAEPTVESTDAPVVAPEVSSISAPLPPIEKPKRKRAPRRKAPKKPPAETTAESTVEPIADAAADVEPGVEVFDRTEPTPESALDLDQSIDASVGGAPAEIELGLSDTKFGRAVDEFTETSTGPIVEHVEDIEVAQDKPGRAVSDIEIEPVETPPAIARQASPAPVVDAPAAAPLVSDDLVVSEFPSERTKPPTETHLAAPSPLAETEQSETRQLSDVGDLEEFVAMPEDEPTEPMLSLDALEELDKAEAQAAESVDPAPSTDLSTPAIDAEPLTDADLSLDDLEDLDEKQQPTPEPAKAEAPPTAPEPPKTKSPDQAKPAKVGPSLFGFNFDGDSFLGGMPLSLGKTLNAPAAAAADASKAAAFAFTPRPTGPSGIGAMVPPRSSPAVAPAPQARAPIAQPAPTSPVRSTPAVPAGRAPQIPAVAAPAPPPVKSVTPPSAPPRAVPPPPARPTTQPPVIPRPSVRRPGASSAPPSLSLLDLAAGQSHNESTEPPAIPSIAAEMSVPPLARPTTTRPSARRPLSTAFDGLAGGGGGNGSRNVDVFSQMASPISAEAFGSKRGDPDDFDIPDIDSQQQTRDAANAAKTRPAARPGETRRGPSAPIAPRRSRVPMLLVLMLLLAAGAWPLVYRVVPNYAQVTGVLGFHNLAAQSQGDQKAFRMEQVRRLHGAETRNEALAFLEAGKVPPGFLASPQAFDEAIDRPGALNWKDETLEISLQSPDGGGAAREQMAALLSVLSQKDVDLMDALNRAQREAADAKAAVDKASLKIDLLKKQIGEQQAAGEDRPDPIEKAKLDADAANLIKQRDAASAARIAAEDALAKLQALDPNKPLDATTDPKVLELRKQYQDISGQIATLKASNNGASAATTQPAGDLAAASGDELQNQLQEQADALNTKINERLTAIQADQAITPEQRAVNREKAIEEQSVRVGALQDQEKAAIKDAQAAVAKADDARDRLEKSRLATTVITDLQNKAIAADAEHAAAATTQAEKEAALAKCISLEAGGPRVTTQLKQDERPFVAGGASLAILIIFSLMIFSAHRAAQAHAAHTAAETAVPLPVEPLSAFPSPPASSNGDGEGTNGDGHHRDRQKATSEEDEEALPV